VCILVSREIAWIPYLSRSRARRPAASLYRAEGEIEISVVRTIRPISKAVSLTAALAIAIVAILGSGFAPTVSGAVSSAAEALGHATAPAHPTSDATPAGSAMLQRAAASLDSAAQRSGSDVTCQVSSGTQASCTAPTSTLAQVRPAPATHGGMTVTSGAVAVPSSPRSVLPSSIPVPSTGDPAWHNVTANTTALGGPTVGLGTRMAFDPLLGEVVLFAGESVASDAPNLNLTWVYNGIQWVNLTSSLHTAPSVRFYPGFDYDPAFGGVILIGGWSAADMGLNDTWLFTGTWSNISLQVGNLVDDFGDNLTQGGQGGGAGAWDPALGGFLLTSGCTEFGCVNAAHDGTGTAYSLTWLLTPTDGWQTIDYGPGYGSDTWLGFTSMAYDPTGGYMVLFGGWDWFAYAPENWTYTYSGGAAYGSNWVNVSASDAGCKSSVCQTPPGRDDMSMTWDAQAQAVFMTGGFNDSYGVYNDTWEFVGGQWYPSTPAPPAGYAGVEGPALAVNSTDIGVFLVGGLCLAINCAQNEWVFETPPSATLAEAPASVDLGTAVTFTAGWTVGTGTGYTAGWNVSYGNGHFGASRAANGANTSTAYTKAIPYTYPAAGAYTATVTWSDFFYINATSTSVSVTVNPALVASISASATSITAGGKVTFTTSPTGGSGTYTYAWSFGDGTTSTVQDPAAHAFGKAGTYAVNLTVTDSVGGSVKSNVTITVKAAPTGLSLSGSTLTYLLLGIVVLVVVVAAVVLLTRRRKQPTTAQPWQAGAPPVGAGGPPPGAGGETSPPPPPPPS
jgi:PKD repeat protein